MSTRASSLISRFPARRVAFSDGDAATGPGGGLAAAVDRLGAPALALVLAEGEQVRLEDEGVALVVRREGPGQAVLRVEWQDGPAFEERLALPEAEPAGPAPAGPSPLPAAPAAQPSPAAPPPPAAAVGRPVTDLAAALLDVEQPLWVCDDRVYQGGPGPGTLRALVPATSPARLGSEAFRQAHGVRAAYIAGAMAGGIASEELVLAMSGAGMLGFFGAGGLDEARVAQAVERVAGQARGGPFGFNLLHNPVEPQVEERTVDLYLRGGVRAISASAFMRLTPAVVRYRVAGIRREGDRVVSDQRVLAKLSRPEVAEQFLRPAPEALLRELVQRGAITAAQAALAATVPVAEDVTVEADSGGHTDRRPLVAMFPVIRRLRDRIAREQGYAARGILPRVGAAGGLGDPASVHAAFALGADYVLTGSVNQAARESGTSDLARQMLAEAGVADCTTGPAPDMFELGAQVQVLGRGSMWAQRAQRLYELYRAWPSLEAIPAAEREKLERQVFRRTLESVWAETEAFWRQRDPREVARAEADPHHKMALTFRWYLGMSSRWARTGDPERKRDYQVWSGPAIGLFNDWVAGTWLEPLPARGVVEIARALLHGAAVLARVQALRAAGVPVPVEVDPPAPWRG
ncbi:PfaD family polyunsaturated fatty acid/polyketide biosynthesis protein [Myxococcota bacterium]|nr:PfaD family polyunsaturated fatty acid/polyketide biosynthesis protein [Myxococcota bacterium]